MRYHVIEALNDKHVEELVALYQSEWWSKDRTLGDVKKMLLNTDILFALIETSSDRLVGFTRVLTDRVYRAIVFDVIVASDKRGKKLGMILMNAVIAHPDLKTIESLELHCLPELEPFYAKWGFARNSSGTRTLRRRAALATRETA